MFNSGILDVVIGLIFVYLTLSLVVTAANEFIEAFRKKRAADLERGLREMLTDDSSRDPKDYLASLYNHPLVFSLFKGQYPPAKTKDLPSYIPARNFALALMDVLMPAEKRGATASLQELRAVVAQVENEKVKNAVLPLIDAAGTDIDKARANIEAWYNSSMDRVGGWYKRRAQWFSFGLGLIIAVGLNADTITIYSRLSYDAAMRDSLVAASQEYAKANAPSATAPSPAPDQTSPIEACKTDASSPECKVAKNLAEIRKLGLPIGWDNPNLPVWDNANAFASIWAWVLKLAGWAITALAISLGAPFWFDLLNKFMVARSTLKPKEQSPEQAKTPSATLLLANAPQQRPGQGGGA